MKETECIEIVGGNTRNESIELGNHEQVDSIYGGAFLVNCEVNICGANFKIVDANFLNCRINARHPIVDVHFLESVFERAVLAGEFRNCSFGFQRGVSASPNAYYRNCDFSDAVLDKCRFFTGDTETVKWPMWPNIAVLNPGVNEKDWTELVFPSAFNSLREELSSVLNHDTVGGDANPLAVTIDLSRYSDDSTDLQALKIILEQKSYINFSNH
jgi:hypothetical protein